MSLTDWHFPGAQARERGEREQGASRDGESRWRREDEEKGEQGERGERNHFGGEETWFHGEEWGAEADETTLVLS